MSGSIRAIILIHSPAAAIVMNFFKKLFTPKPRAVKTDITKRFDLIGRVGQGSMSKVWRARDTLSGRMCALKVLDKAKTLRFEGRFDPKLKKPSEGEVAVALKHPNIVQTWEWGTTYENEQFLVMEFVEGVCLSFLVDVQNEQMQRNRLWYMIQLGEAIRYLHQQNWIHRDICPRNILITEDDTVKLIDFGLVVPNIAAFQAPGNRTGTANYMAPELIKRQRTDQRIDIFSYAVTCYEMFTRRYPWDAGETLDMAMQHINTPPVPIANLVPGIDPQVADAIMQGLATDPHDRWRKIDDMVDQLRKARTRLEPAKPRADRQEALG